MTIKPESLEYLRGLAETEDQQDMPPASTCLRWAVAEIERLNEALAHARNGIRLCIGMRTDTPWHNVPDSDVDGYIGEASKRARRQQAVAEIERLEDACAYAVKCLASNHALCFPNDDRIIVLEEASKRACTRRNQPTQGE